MKLIMKKYTQQTIVILAVLNLITKIVLIIQNFF
jgi:hypothetical protein